MNTSGTRLLCLGLIAAGTVLSAHLFFRHLDLATAGAGHAGDFCSAVFGQGCDGALLSAVWALGIPAAGWGLVYYGTLAALLVLGWILRRPFEGEAALAALALSVAGALASVALLVFLLAGRVPFCPLCGVAHLINFTLVFALFRLTGRSWRGVVQAFGAAARYLAGGAVADATMARWKLVGFLSVVLVAVVAYQWARVEVRLRGAQPTPFDPQRTWEAFERSEQHSIPVDADDIVLGAASPAVRLVVFSDYQCPACARFSHEMSLLTERFAELQIVIKHFPLSRRCNASLAADLHPRACEAAWAVEAARQQGKFEGFHDALFHADLSAPEAFRTVARSLGLDLERFDTDRQAAKVRKKVEADVDLGGRLGIEGTPWILLNGRHVADSSLPALTYLIARLLERTDP